MSHLGNSEKKALHQVFGGISSSHACASGHSSLNFSMFSFHLGTFVALAQAHTWFFTTSPLWSWFMFWCMCRTQNRCSESGNNSRTALISPYNKKITLWLDGMRTWPNNFFLCQINLEKKILLYLPFVYSRTITNYSNTPPRQLSLQLDIYSHSGRSLLL